MPSQENVVSMDDRGSPRPASLSDLRLEGQVIGAVLADNKALRHCSGIDLDAFTDDLHRELWSAINDLINAGRKTTPATLAAHFGPDRIEQLGGREMLASLVRDSKGLSGGLDVAVERLRDLMLWRKLDALHRDIGQWIQRRGMTADEAIAALLREGEGVLQSGHGGARSKSQVARAALEQAITPTSPTSTGIESLDYLLHGGLVRKRTVAIGGETGAGKTILLGSISENINYRGAKHLYISLETPGEDIEIRNIARRLNANAAQIYDQDTPDHQRVHQYAQSYLDNIRDCTYFEWAPGATINDIRRYIVHAVHRHEIEGVIIDYWQLIRGRERGQSEEGHLREVANKLAEIARRENIWILIAAQVDEAGRIKISDAIKQASSLYLRLMRSESDTIAHFRTEKSNYTRYADTGSSASPGMIFNDSGPHFGTPSPQDIPEAVREEGSDAIDV